MKRLIIEPTKDTISEIADENKSKILNYLKNGRVIAAVPGIMMDVFTKANIVGVGEWVVRTDGIYEWDTLIIYYYEKYNLKLPKDFLEHISSF